MAEINVSVNVGDAIKRLGDIGRQIPFVASLAINRTGQKVKAKEEHEIRDVFDRPTPYIQRSIFLKPSNKSNLTATVGIKDQAGKGIPATKVLDAEIAGGPRKLKRFEVALRRVGALPNGYFIVPGAAAQIDQYGNIARKQITQILAFFKAFPEAGYKANSTDKTRAKLKRGSKKRIGVSYFVGRPNNGKSPLGIWQVQHQGLFTGPGRPLRPVFIFVPHVIYQPIFDFKFVAESTVKKEFDGEFERAYREVIGA